MTAPIRAAVRTIAGRRGARTTTARVARSASRASRNANGSGPPDPNTAAATKTLSADAGNESQPVPSPTMYDERATTDPQKQGGDRRGGTCSQSPERCQPSRVAHRRVTPARRKREQRSQRTHRPHRESHAAGHQVHGLQDCGERSREDRPPGIRSHEQHRELGGGEDAADRPGEPDAEPGPSGPASRANSRRPRCRRTIAGRSSQRMGSREVGTGQLRREIAPHVVRRQVPHSQGDGEERGEQWRPPEPAQNQDPCADDEER